MVAAHWTRSRPTLSKLDRRKRAIVSQSLAAERLPRLTIDPVDRDLVRAWCRLARKEWGLSAIAALTLLASLCGYTTLRDSADALGMQIQTVKNTRRIITANMRVGNMPGAVGLAWPLYRSLRTAAIARYRAQRGYIAA